MQHFSIKVLFGALLWAVVYFASLPMLPIIKTDPYFFKTLIGFVFTVSTMLFTVLFFTRIQARYLQEGVMIGILWMIISLLIDIPIFVYGQANMLFATYFRDIGLTYVAIPVITIGVGFLIEKKTLALKRNMNNSFKK